MRFCGATLVWVIQACGIAGVVTTAQGNTSAAVVVAQREQTTVWDGVFTDAQAKRGKTGYVIACGYCHRDDLSGGGGDEPGLAPPALAGSSFLASWRDASVAELAGTIAATMPRERPKLDAQAYIDIVSFLLKANGMPAGDWELPLDGERLKGIRITEKTNR